MTTENIIGRYSPKKGMVGDTFIRVLITHHGPRYDSTYLYDDLAAILKDIRKELSDDMIEFRPTTRGGNIVKVVP